MSTMDETYKYSGITVVPINSNPYLGLLRMVAKRSMKLFFLCVSGFFVIIIIISLCKGDQTVPHMKNDSLIYILHWALLERHLPERYMSEGVQTFVKHNCSYQNCYETTNKYFFRDIRDFDALLFYSKEIAESFANTPKLRSPNQTYIFASIESSHYYPLCKSKYNDFFNLTWTYKLNSDLVYSYFIVKNKEGDIIGPNKTMHWLKVEDMMPINETLKNKLKSKRKAAAWLVGNCGAVNRREIIVGKLREELERYKLAIDVYGHCSPLKCGRGSMPDCWDLIESDYYFYLSFENSFSEDYVTEKLLNPLLHYTVPIVYGEANYTRFVPEGMYLDARKLKIKQLAKEMYDIMNDQERYFSFFKWHNHYTYHNPDDVPETNNYCKLCAFLNTRLHTTTQEKSMYGDIRNWWNPSHYNCALDGITEDLIHLFLDTFVYYFVDK